MKCVKLVKVKYFVSLFMLVGIGVSFSCWVVSSVMVRGDVELMWWMCSFAFGNLVMNEVSFFIFRFC